MAVERAVGCNRAKGKPIDFWSLKLPKETQAYVPKLLAMRRLVADPESLRHRHQPDSEPALFRARRYPRPDRPEGGRGNRRRHRRRALRAQPGLPPLGHRPDRPALPAAAGRRRAGVHAEHRRSSPKISACTPTHYTVSSGDSVASVAKRFNTTVNVVRETERSAHRCADGRHGPARSVSVRRAAAESAAGRGARRWPHDALVAPPARARRAGAGDSLWGIARRTRHGREHARIDERHAAGRHAARRSAPQAVHQRCAAGAGAAAGPHARSLTWSAPATRSRRLPSCSRFGLADPGLERHRPRSSISPGQKLTIRVASRRG